MDYILINYILIYINGGREYLHFAPEALEDVRRLATSYWEIH